MLNPSFIKLAKLYISHHLPDYLELFHPSIDASIDWTQPFHSVKASQLQNHASLGQVFQLSFIHQPHQSIYLYWDFNDSFDQKLIEQLSSKLLELYTQQNIKAKCCLLLNTDLVEQPTVLKLIKNLQEQFNLVFDCTFIKALDKRLAVNTCTPLLEMLLRAIENKAKQNAYHHLEKMLAVLPLTFCDLSLLNEMLQLI